MNKSYRNVDENQFYVIAFIPNQSMRYKWYKKRKVFLRRTSVVIVILSFWPAFFILFFYKSVDLDASSHLVTYNYILQHFIWGFAEISALFASELIANISR